jgi:hypothetical protein
MLARRLAEAQSRETALGAKVTALEARLVELRAETESKRLAADKLEASLAELARLQAASESAAPAPAESAAPAAPSGDEG